MSILDYFSVRLSKSFPNPRGPLSSRIPSAAIESANREVCAALNKEQPVSSQKGKKPRIYSPQERAELGKLAVSFLTATAYLSTTFLISADKLAPLPEKRPSILHKCGIRTQNSIFETVLFY